MSVAAEPKYGDPAPDGYVDASIYSENNTHYLVKVISSRLDVTQCAWYKIHKQDKVVVFFALHTKLIVKSYAEQW